MRTMEAGVVTTVHGPYFRDGLIELLFGLLMLLNASLLLMTESVSYPLMMVWAFSPPLAFVKLLPMLKARFTEPRIGPLHPTHVSASDKRRMFGFAFALGFATLAFAYFELLESGNASPLVAWGAPALGLCLTILLATMGTVDRIWLLASIATLVALAAVSSPVVFGVADEIDASAVRLAALFAIAGAWLVLSGLATFFAFLGTHPVMPDKY